MRNDSPLAQEVRAVQNEALGAALLGHYCANANADSGSARSVALPLLFVVLPVALHEETCQLAVGTQFRSGLRGFATKLTDHRELLLGLHDRMMAFRVLSLRSLRVALAYDLLKFELAEASVRASLRKPPKKLVDAVGPMFRSVARLGVWTQGLSVLEVGAILHVDF